jgi:hypothetical protein
MIEIITILICQLVFFFIIWNRFTDVSDELSYHWKFISRNNEWVEEMGSPRQYRVTKKDIGALRKDIEHLLRDAEDRDKKMDALAKMVYKMSLEDK